jgi:hypothetical protein
MTADDRDLGTATWPWPASALSPHSLENVGGAEIRVISGEIKQPVGSE